MGLCDVRTAFRHAIPAGYFSHYEVSDIAEACAVPAEFRCAVRGMERGNHREGAEVKEVEFCAHHLHAFEEVDKRLRGLGWAPALHGPPVPVPAA
jgi:hypothetical protein